MNSTDTQEMFNQCSYAGGILEPSGPGAINGGSHYNSLGGYS